MIVRSYVRSYEDAARLLTGRCKDSRRLENNTYLVRLSDTEIGVRLHSTIIVRYYANGDIQLSNGGWSTFTSSGRINTYTPNNMGVNSIRGSWYLKLNGTQYDWERGGVLIRADGQCDAKHIGDAYEYERQELNKLRRDNGVNKLRYWVRQARLHKPGKLTVQGIIDEPNASIRVAKMAAYGIDRFMCEANPNVLESVAGYDLVSFGHTGWGDGVVALKMTCPSTGAVYINTVPPYLRSVREAVDWMFDCKDYLDKVGQQT